MATQNPIEQEGTYLPPEAQVDRFVSIARYPVADEELRFFRICQRLIIILNVMPVN